MSNKPFNRLNPLDRALHQTYPPRMEPNGTQVLIRKFDGFEVFNTRPYHNYETWSDGYEATDGTWWATAEDLDDCLAKLIHARKTGEGTRLLPHLRQRFTVPDAQEARDGE